MRRLGYVAALAVATILLAGVVAIPSPGFQDDPGLEGGDGAEDLAEARDGGSTRVRVNQDLECYWERALEYNWSMEKTMDPEDSLLSASESVDVDVTIFTYREGILTLDEKGLRGTILIENRGNNPTVNLFMIAYLYGNEKVAWVPLDSFEIDLEGDLAPGEIAEIDFQRILVGVERLHTEYKVLLHCGMDNGLMVSDYEEYDSPGVEYISIRDQGSIVSEAIPSSDGLEISVDDPGPWRLYGARTISYTMNVFNPGTDPGVCFDLYCNTTLMEDGTYQNRTASGMTKVCTLGQGQEPPGTIEVLRFNDTNMNGLMDQGESPLTGWWVAVQDVDGSEVANGTTDDSGIIVFEDMVPGNYTVMGEMREGWINTTPSTIPIELGPGATVEIDFGNVQMGGISVFKFLDPNSNGEYDNDDIPLSNWNITVSMEDQNTTLMTDVNGWANFTDLMPGVYLVEDYLPEGWNSTTGASFVVEVGPGENEIVMFGSEIETAIYDIVVEVWEDLDLNGVRDQGEPALEGWTIELRDDAMALIETGTSSEEGLTFSVNRTGTYHLILLPEEGWFNVTPSMQILEVPSMLSARFGNAEYCEIDVMKFRDKDMDGSLGVDEEGMADWSMMVDGPGGIIERVTDDNGWANFTGLIPGEYTISEQEDGMWFPTTLSSVEIELVSSGESMVVLFGNAMKGTIEALKFNDMDQDGIQDVDESGIQGWTIEIYQEEERVALASTDLNGVVTFSELMPGSYIVRETQMPGWFSTTPSEYEIDIGEGSSVSVEFGNCMYASIEASAYHDGNADGEWQTSEDGLEGWIIDIEGQGISINATTDLSGKALFDQLMPGEYMITTESREGWLHTTPMTMVFSIAPGQSLEVMFGHHEFSMEYSYIFGCKFYDPDMNGTWDVGEEPVEGWNLSLVGNDIEAWKLTDQDGEAFFVVPSGTYQLTEESRSGWFCTTPPSVWLVAELGQVQHVMFGNARTSEIVAYKFLDTDRDGNWDEGEYPIQNWRITISNEGGMKLGEAWTDAEGRVIFEDLIPGTYIVREEIRFEWECTTPAEFEVTVSSGDREEIVFGNYMDRPCIDVTKTGPMEAIWGTEVTWEIRVWNCGNSPLVNIYLNDSRLDLREFIDHLSIGEMRTYLVSEYIPIGYEGEWIENNATAVGWADGETQVWDRDCHKIFILKPGIDVKKTGPESAERGETIEYTITVRNTGNVLLHLVYIYDEQVDFMENLSVLMPGETVIFIVEFTIPEDWNIDHLTNWVMVEATYFGMLTPMEYHIEDQDCHEIDITDALDGGNEGPCGTIAAFSRTF